MEDHRTRRPLRPGGRTDGPRRCPDAQGGLAPAPGPLQDRSRSAQRQPPRGNPTPRPQPREQSAGTREQSRQRSRLPGLPDLPGPPGIPRGSSRGPTGASAWLALGLSGDRCPMLLGPWRAKVISRTTGSVPSGWDRERRAGHPADPADSGQRCQPGWGCRPSPSGVRPGPEGEKAGPWPPEG